MNTNFDRVFSLAKKSNSRLVVFDKQEGEHFVVLGIDDFESLLTDQKSVKTEAVPVLSSVPPSVSVPAITPVTEQTIDSDLDQDARLLQKLNEQIADWRRSELEKISIQTEPEEESEIEIKPKSEPNLESLPRPVTQPVTIPVKIEPEPELIAPPVSQKSSGSWHRLGDVIAESSLAKVSYEPLGEQGIKPIISPEINEYAEPEPLNEDPVFLEEPLS